MKTEPSIATIRSWECCQHAGFGVQRAVPVSWAKVNGWEHFSLESSGRISSKITIWCRSRWSCCVERAGINANSNTSGLLSRNCYAVDPWCRLTDRGYRFCNRSISSLNFNLSAAGTLWERVMTERTSVLTSRWTSAGVPRGQLKTSGYFDRTCSVVGRTCNAGDVPLGSGGETVMMFMWWAARAPIMGGKFSRTTTNSMIYRLPFCGFLVMTRACQEVWALSCSTFGVACQLVLGHNLEHIAPAERWLSPHNQFERLWFGWMYAVLHICTSKGTSIGCTDWVNAVIVSCTTLVTYSIFTMHGMNVVVLGFATNLRKVALHSTGKTRFAPGWALLFYCRMLSFTILAG